MSLFSRLYQGETAYDFIGKRRRWYAISALLLLVSLGGLLIRGFNLGVDFTGGAVFEFEPTRATTVTEVSEKIDEVIASDPRVEKIGGGTEASYRVKTKALTPAEVDAVSDQISTNFGVKKEDINPTSVSPTWGDQITNKALLGLGVFLLAVILYISVRFEPKMAAASIAALFHDILITAGIYALVGFEVTPSTVIAFLTILGYSLYDNIVVFDKVRENTLGLAGGNRMTYSDAANLSINQTIMRSVNTTLTSLLPVGSLLFVGVFVLGAGSLKDLSLSLFVGMAAGAYSSVFFATPLLVEMKEREPQFKALRSRVAARQGARGDLATAGAGVGAARATGRVTTRTTGTGGTAAKASGGTLPAAPASGTASDAAGDEADGDEAAATPARATPARAGAGRPQPRPAKKKPGKGGRPHGKRRR